MDEVVKSRKHDTVKRLRTRSGYLPLTIFLLPTGVFIIDLIVPLGAAVYIPYVIAIVLSSHLPNPQAPVVTAAVCTVLALLGMMLSVPGPSAWIVFTNRILIIVVIWVTALLVRQRQALHQMLQQERDRLEQRVEARTAELAQTNAQLKSARRRKTLCSSSAIYCGSRSRASLTAFSPRTHRDA
jgi:K+-sensing histidine kinase KdpD